MTKQATKKPRKHDWTEEDLKRQAQAAAGLIDFLQQIDDDDEDLVQDSIEGETDFLETIDRALEIVAEAEMMAKAIAERVGELNARKDRHKARAEHVRSLISMSMLEANGDERLRPLPFTLRTPAATVTLQTSQGRPLIVDEAKVPAQFWKVPAPVIDKAALNEYCAEIIAGDPDGDVIEGVEPKTVPEGVEIPEPGVSLRIRRK